MTDRPTGPGSKTDAMARLVASLMGLGRGTRTDIGRQAQYLGQNSQSYGERAGIVMEALRTHGVVYIESFRWSPIVGEWMEVYAMQPALFRYADAAKPDEAPPTWVARRKRVRSVPLPRAEEQAGIDLARAWGGKASAE